MTCELCGNDESMHGVQRNVIGARVLFCPPLFTTRFRAQEGVASPNSHSCKDDPEDREQSSSSRNRIHETSAESPTYRRDGSDLENYYGQDIFCIPIFVSSTVREAPPAGYPMLKSEEATLAAAQFRDEPPPEFYPDPAAPQGAGR